MAEGGEARWRCSLCCAAAAAGAVSAAEAPAALSVLLMVRAASAVAAVLVVLTELRCRGRDRGSHPCTVCTKCGTARALPRRGCRTNVSIQFFFFRRVAAPVRDCKQSQNAPLGDDGSWPLRRRLSDCVWVINSIVR